MVISSKTCRKLIYFQLLLVMVEMFFISQFHLPSIITYITDIVSVILLLYMAYAHKSELKRIRANYVGNLILLFVGVSILGAVFNFVPPLLTVWGARNIFRGFIFFVACIRFLDEKDTKKIFDILFKLQIVNIILSLFQYFIQGYNQDNLGGIFGTQSGCNGYTNIFFVILLSYYVAAYMTKKEPVWKVAVVAVSTMLLAGLAELKIFYFEFALIILLCVIFVKPSFKTILIALIAVVAAVLGLKILEAIFPLQYYYLINYDKYLVMQSGGYNIPRIGAFTYINEHFFNGSIINELFGFGLGNCEMSSFSFLVSDFYKAYGNYNYRWFSHMMFYLEEGIIGFGLLLAIFAGIFVYATKSRKILENFGENLHIAIFTQVFVIMVVVNFWYNQAIRTEAQYLIYLVLAMCFIQVKSIKIQKRGI